MATNTATRAVLARRRLPFVASIRYKSTNTVQQPASSSYNALNEQGDVPSSKQHQQHQQQQQHLQQEMIQFPSSQNQEEGQPLLLNAKEHAVGYLSRILNARVYEAAIETELQYAANLSSVCA
jgi:hypothetical protein